MRHNQSCPVVVPVILCGGVGSRLYPLSSLSYPKQFLSLNGDTSLLRDTVDRALRISAVSNLVFVTAQDFAQEVKSHISDINQETKMHILQEPCGRNTAAAVTLAALYVRQVFGRDAVMWVMPSDLCIGDEQALKAAYQDAVFAARQEYLVTFGIKPSRPETGYGYIKCGEKLADSVGFKVMRFVEKPNFKTAQGYVSSGNYLWNSGMFVFKADRVLEQLTTYAPDVLKCVEAALRINCEGVEIDPSLYALCPKTPFDKAVLEKSDCVASVHCDPQWSDVGSWGSLWTVKSKDASPIVKIHDQYYAMQEIRLDQADRVTFDMAGFLVVLRGQAKLTAGQAETVYQEAEVIFLDGVQASQVQSARDASLIIIAVNKGRECLPYTKHTHILGAN